MRWIVVVGLMAVVLCGGCRRNAATGRSQLLLMSVNDTIALGKESSPLLIEQYGSEIESRDVASSVAMVGRSMAELTEADYPGLPWEFTVLDSDVINAFALPGGKVFASRGLLARLERDAELAGARLVRCLQDGTSACHDAAKNHPGGTSDRFLRRICVAGPFVRGFLVTCRVDRYDVALIRGSLGGMR